MRRPLAFALAALAFVPLMDPRDSAEGGAQPAGLRAPALDGASVAGRVTFAGDEPEPVWMSLGTFKNCDSVDDHTERWGRELRVGAARGLRDAVVVLVPADGSELPLPADRVVPRFDITHAQFEPHVLVVPHANQVEVANHDECSHNIHTYSRRNPGVNKVLQSGATMRIPAERAEAYMVSDDLHPWMQAWVYVSPSPLFGLTDIDGTFEIDGVEPGEYEVKLWHPGARTVAPVARLKVGDDGVADLALQMRAR